MIESDEGGTWRVGIMLVTIVILYCLNGIHDRLGEILRALQEEKK